MDFRLESSRVVLAAPKSIIISDFWNSDFGWSPTVVDLVGSLSAFRSLRKSVAQVSYGYHGRECEINVLGYSFDGLNGLEGGDITRQTPRGSCHVW
jgi:hypothetical protein